MKIISTICSKKKDQSVEVMPAHLRYLATHIETAYNQSKNSGIPFFILSGLYGLVASEDLIPNYDYYLEEGRVAELSILLARQIKNLGITEIDLLMEEKETWKPYIEALEKGAQKSGCVLNKKVLESEPLTT